MRSRASVAPVAAGVLVAMAAGVALAGACGGDEGINPAAGDGGDDGSVADGATGVVDAPFGLDARPANPTCRAPRRPAPAPKVKFVPVFASTAFTMPLRLAQIPGDRSRFFVLQRTGEIVTFPAASPPAQPQVVYTFTGINYAAEGGLLGMAFHPDFAHNGYLYASYTPGGGTTGMQSMIVRLESPNRDGLSFVNPTTILVFDQEPAPNHKGGNVLFGSDGYLYAGFGDGGGGGDTFHHGQDTTTFFSKILRIDVDHPGGGKPYGIPPDNPFASGGGGLPEIFAWGFRNPWRWSFDRGSGDLWVGDVGQNAWEEIDAPVGLGGNYGWSLVEGTHCTATAVSPCPLPGLVAPIYEYDHVTDGSGKSITGGYVYRGKAIPGFVGTYVFADFVIGKIWALTRGTSGEVVVTPINPTGPVANWASFSEDEDGEIYALDIGGKIYEMVADGGADAGAGEASFPQKLSQTGCVDPKDPKTAVAGAIPYDVNSPAWSDGATARHWMALPDGKTIHVDSEGDWDLPVGSVLMQELSVAGKRVETRLFVRHDDGGWAGYSYAWDDAESDATLLAPANAKRTLAGGTSWYSPSRAECFGCHTGEAGRTLGVENGQLDRAFVYEGTRRRSNQLATLDHVGMFDAPLPSLDTIVPYPTPTDPASGSLEARARSYLHANCSSCHRLGGAGSGSGTTDLRYATPFAATSTCDAAPTNGDLRIGGAAILLPGDPARSLLSVRSHRLDVHRMPSVGSRVVDVAGVGVVDDWIRSLASCPAGSPAPPPLPPSDAGGD